MIDWTKPIETVDGRPARFAGKINDKNGFEYLVIYAEDELTDDFMSVNGNGEGWRGSYPNIRNVPPSKRKVWVARLGTMLMSNTFESEALARRCVPQLQNWTFHEIEIEDPKIVEWIEQNVPEDG